MNIIQTIFNRRAVGLSLTIAATSLSGALFAPMFTPLFAQGKNFDLEYRVSLGVAKEGNIFRLDSQGKLDLENPNANAIANGRYEGMDGVDDRVLSPEFQVIFDFPKGLEMAVTLGYNYHMINKLVSFPEIEYQIEKRLADRLWVGFEFPFMYKSLRKNYLAEAIDADGSGNIQGGERQYANGFYSEIEPSFFVAYRLAEGDRSKITAPRINAEFNFAYHNRWYDAPFENRSRSGVIPGVVFEFDFARKFDLTLGYAFGAIKSPAGIETTLVDELNFNSDIDGDGQTLNNTRYEQKIDRSRSEHHFNIEVAVPVSEKIEVGAGLAVRKLKYSTDNKYDAGNYQREQTRKTFELELSYDFRDNLRFSADLSKASYEDTNTAGVERLTQTDFGFATRYSF